MELNATTIPGLLTAFNASFSAGYQKLVADKSWDKVAMGVTSSTRSQTYPWMDKVPALAEWLGSRTASNLETRYQIVQNRRYTSSLMLDRTLIEDDQFGVYAPVFEGLGIAAAKWPDIIVADALIHGTDSTYGLAPDGAYFFSASHPQDPNQSASPTQSNLYTGRALTPANYGYVRSQMRSLKGADGQPLGIKPTKLIVPPSLEPMARQILMSDQIASQYLTDSTNAQVGGQTNIYKGTADLVVYDELTNGSGDTPGAWYLSDDSKPVKGLVWQTRIAPQIIPRFNPADPSVYENDQLQIGVYARGAPGYLIWQCIAKCTP